MKLPSQENIRICGEKGNVQILGNIGSWHHQTSGDERKNLKRVPLENKRATWNQAIEQEHYKKNKYLGLPPHKIFRTILEIELRRT